jgi:hypothetical protein
MTTAVRKSSATARRKAAACRGKEPNGNSRVTVAVLGTKLDNLADDVKGLRSDHDQHVSDGTKVFERLSTIESKWTMLMWGGPITLTVVGIVASILFALR